MSYPQIPARLIQVQQTVLVVTVAISLLLNQPMGIAALFGVLLVARITGSRFNPIFRITRLLAGSWVAAGDHEDPLTQRFNQTLAVLFLGISTGLLSLGYTLWGWTVALMVASLALIALAGFCVGCFIYFHIRRWSTLRASR